MLALDLIVESRSPWSNPVLMVPKKDGSFRFCLDSRRLNSVTKGFVYPIPRISHILNCLRYARYISSIDMAKAFWQIPLDPSSCEKTSFAVPGRGTFMFKRLAFGLRNAPSELQRLVDELFGPEFDSRVFAYVDDLIIVSEDFDGHMDLLRKVHGKLKGAGLTINLKKSEFCKARLRYLGYIVDSEGLRTDPSKVDAIKNFPTPTNATQVKSFIGLCGYYRSFINNFSHLASPLTRLTCGKRNKSNFVWDENALSAFTSLKQAMVSAPVLACPDFSLTFIIHCDSSNFAIGASLTQVFPDGEHPIAFHSRCLSKAEKNYSTTEKELLAILDSVYHYRGYIDGAKFTVITDHSSLKWLLALDNPSGRLARWAT